MPDSKFTLKGEVIAGEDSAAFRWVLRGTNTADLVDGTPATHKSGVLDGATIVKFEHGKIIYEGDYYNDGPFYDQLGLSDAETSQTGVQKQNKNKGGLDVSGRTIIFDDGATAVFSRNGDYSYKYPDGKVDRGTWLQRDDIVCILFRPGGSRCDRYGKNQGVNQRHEVFKFVVR